MKNCYWTFSFLLLLNVAWAQEKKIEKNSLKKTVDNRFLIIGGGGTPSGSQVEIENNMKRVKALIDEFAPHSPTTYLFGAGNNRDQKDVMIKKEGVNPIDIGVLKIITGKDCINCTFRHNELDFLDGATSYRTIPSYLNRESQEKYQKGQGFRFYFMGHGYPSRDKDGKKHYKNNRAHIWEDSSFHVNFLTEMLDDFPEQVPIQLVMVQCFSGGFAQINYKKGKYLGDISSANRCGFFSQRANRLAAGCSPYLEESKGYTRYFHEAVKNFQKNDFNGDGKLGMDEIHSAIIAHSESFDIPVKTSDHFLTDLVKMRKIAPSGADKLYSWNEFAKILDPGELYLAKSLLKKIQLESIYTNPQERKERGFVTKVESLSETYSRLEEAINKINESQNKALEEFGNIIRSDMYYKTPDLYFHSYISDKEYKDFIIKMKKNPFFTPLRKLYQAKRKSRHSVDMSLLRAYAERLYYLVKSKILEKKLFKSKNQEAIKKYRQLKSCEALPYF